MNICQLIISSLLHVQAAADVANNTLSIAQLFPKLNEVLIPDSLDAKKVRDILNSKHLSLKCSKLANFVECSWKVYDFLFFFFPWRTILKVRHNFDLFGEALISLSPSFSVSLSLFPFFLLAIFFTNP